MEATLKSGCCPRFEVLPAPTPTSRHQMSFELIRGSCVWQLHRGTMISTTPRQHRVAHIWLLHAHEQAVDDGGPVLFSALPQIVVQNLPPAHANVLCLAQRPADVHLPAAAGSHESADGLEPGGRIGQPLAQRLHLQEGSRRTGQAVDERTGQPVQTADAESCDQCAPACSRGQALTTVSELRAAVTAHKPPEQLPAQGQPAGKQGKAAA